MAETKGNKPRRQRLFVALDLPEQDARRGRRRGGRAELVDPALRPVRPESLHVTLVFLGHREAAEVEAIADVVRESGVRGGPDEARGPDPDAAAQAGLAVRPSGAFSGHRQTSSVVWWPDWPRRACTSPRSVISGPT